MTCVTYWPDQHPSVGVLPFYTFEQPAISDGRSNFSRRCDLVLVANYDYFVIPPCVTPLCLIILVSWVSVGYSLPQVNARLMGRILNRFEGYLKPMAFQLQPLLSRLHASFMFTFCHSSRPMLQSPTV